MGHPQRHKSRHSGMQHLTQLYRCPAETKEEHLHRRTEAGRGEQHQARGVRDVESFRLTNTDPEDVQLCS